MNNSELAQIGRQLAAQLEDLMEEGYPKSDEYTGLSWEADILRAKARDLEDDCGVGLNFRESVISNYCGPAFRSRIPEIIARVKAFHTAYDEQARA